MTQEQIDAFIGSDWGIVRLLKSEKDGGVFDSIAQVWVESDDDFRKRILETLTKS